MCLVYEIDLLKIRKEYLPFLQAQTLKLLFSRNPNFKSCNLSKMCVKNLFSYSLLEPSKNYIEWAVGGQECLIRIFRKRINSIQEPLNWICRLLQRRDEISEFYLSIQSSHEWTVCIGIRSGSSIVKQIVLELCSLHMHRHQLIYKSFVKAVSDNKGGLVLESHK